CSSDLRERTLSFSLLPSIRPHSAGWVLPILLVILHQPSCRHAAAPGRVAAASDGGYHQRSLTPISFLFFQGHHHNEHARDRTASAVSVGTTATGPSPGE